jgi:hypothetical protein
VLLNFFYFERFILHLQWPFWGTQHFTTTATLFALALMWNQMEAFVHQCSFCSQSKPASHKLGLYQPLSVPTLSLGCINHCQFPVTLGRPFLRILLVDSLGFSATMIPFLWWFVSSPRWQSSFHVLSPKWKWHVWSHFGLPLTNFLITTHSSFVTFG